MKKIKIISTLGPSSLNNKFLEKTKNKIDLYRLNLSHLTLEKLEENILLLKKNKIKNICVDTEGAQVRSQLCKKRFFKKATRVEVSFENSKNHRIYNIGIYPKFSLDKIKLESKIFIGFDGLVLKIKKIINEKILCEVIHNGYLESNKGIHFENAIQLNFLTKKDISAIKLARAYNIKFFALSFANFAKDVVKFRDLIGKKSFLISKIETNNAVKNFTKISDLSNATLIDRGDLSRYVNLIKIPALQELILNDALKQKKIVYVATNLLETMTTKPQPTRAETNDIYHTLKSGAGGLVLAAETAIGKYPEECVDFINKFIKYFIKVK